MKNKMILALLAIIAISGSSAYAAENLIQNPAFKIVKGRVSGWYVRGGDAVKMICPGSEKGKNSVKMPPVPAKNKKAFYQYGNVFQQNLRIKTPGTYIVSAKIASTRKFNETLILIFYKDPKTQKFVYKGAHIKPEGFAETGKWKRKTFECKIPAGIEKAFFAIEIRDHKGDGFVMFESPSFILREE